jgi:hypothetical protein
MIVQRFSQGATKAPPVARPGNGYGRPGRAGPARAWNREALAWRRSLGSVRDFDELFEDRVAIDLTTEDNSALQR